MAAWTRNIWHEGLAKLQQPPSKEWVGTWLSVQGLVDPPYTNNRGMTSVSITANNQIRHISAEEGQRRLQSPVVTTQAQLVDLGLVTGAELMTHLNQPGFGRPVAAGHPGTPQIMKTSRRPAITTAMDPKPMTTATMQ